MPSVIFRIRRPCLMPPLDTQSHSLHILDYLPQGVFILCREGTVVFWNQCLEDWTGILKFTIVGTPIETNFRT